MTNSQSRQDFQDRVRRIEQRQKTAADLRAQDQKSVRRAGKRISATLIMGLATVAALAVLVFTVPQLTDSLPEDFALELPQVDWSPKSPAATNSPTQSDGVISLTARRPEKDKLPTTVTAGQNGIIYPVRFIAGTETPGDRLSLVASNFSGNTGNEIPRSVSTFPLNQTCTLRTPKPDETVRGVMLTDALLPTAVRAITNEQIGSAMARSIAKSIERPRRNIQITQVDGTVKGVNVFVTDTEKPVYLVLQNMKNSVVWNVQAAPGVTIAHVAMISGHAAGVILPPGPTTVEAIRTYDFNTDAEAEPEDGCMTRPWPKPKKHWIAAQKAAKNNMLYENQIETFAKGYNAYNLWFKRELGVDADAVSVTAQQAAHFVLGPLPEEPLPYRPLSRGDLQITDFAHILTGDPDYLNRRVAQINSDVLTAAVGGDLSSLRPPIQRIAPQTASQEADQ